MSRADVVSQVQAGKPSQQQSDLSSDPLFVLEMRLLVARLGPLVFSQQRTYSSIRSTSCTCVHSCS